MVRLEGQVLLYERNIYYHSFTSQVGKRLGYCVHKQFLQVESNNSALPLFMMNNLICPGLFHESFSYVSPHLKYDCNENRCCKNYQSIL